ncbi:hypothetical protein QJS04_geneDACA012244 [Acorus gramineus]|uniref:Nodulin-like domain-containing protein n=1 Tax=Acorus gramineus TaxID=55184 RepID=A0AAV9BC50_ACOGR|nr:hypothetical protein QJS04_geneDACA012244 [Acorus gramineus]
MEWRKWMVLVVTIWIQAFSGTNFDFSAYSSDMKSALGISQVQLNYLAVASDLGKAFGWSSGLALLYLPIWTVLLMAASFGFVGYGLQWLLIRNLLSLPYFLVFLSCLLSGLSVCWFLTVCFVLCVRNFTHHNRSLAISLTVSFNSISPSLYTLAASAFTPSSSSSSSGPIYLLLNAALPLFVSAAAILSILRQQPPPRLPDKLPHTAATHDSIIFLLLNVFAFLTGLYLLLFNTVSTLPSVDSLLFGGGLLLLVMPLFIPAVISARDRAQRAVTDGGPAFGSFKIIDINESQLLKSLLDKVEVEEKWWWCWWKKDRVETLGEDHGVLKLVRRFDFWLYYASYFCGATVGLVYINNLGQIAQSLGHNSSTAAILGVYSACSFFGRLLASAPEFLRQKVYFARTGWLALALIPTPIAFSVLVGSDGLFALMTATGLVGLSSGFVFAAAVSVTSELFGPKSVGVNHNIVITNIPLGSILYGLLATLVYDANEGSSRLVTLRSSDGAAAAACMGRKCYELTFMVWGCISLLGLAVSVALFLRTKPAYDRSERDKV